LTNFVNTACSIRTKQKQKVDPRGMALHANADRTNFLNCILCTKARFRNIIIMRKAYSGKAFYVKVTFCLSVGPGILHSNISRKMYCPITHGIQFAAFCSDYTSAPIANTAFTVYINILSFSTTFIKEWNIFKNPSKPNKTKQNKTAWKKIT
jgi:hypothetical protein